MKKKCYLKLLLCLTTIISIFIISISVQANQATPQSLAVIKVHSSKEDAALARLVRNKIELAFFKTGSFSILEREQIDFVMKEKNINIENLADKQALKLGEFISADYIILGRIEKTDQYILNIRVIEVKSNRIAVSEDAGFTALTDIDQVTAAIIKRIEKKILNLGTVKEELSFKRDFYFSAGYLYLSPQGNFKDIMGSGYGLSVSAGLNSVFVDNLRLGININLFNFDGDGQNTDKARMLPLMVEAGYLFDFNKIFFILLLNLGAGYNTNYHFKYTASNQTEKKSSLQFMTAAGFNFGYTLNEFLLFQTDFKSWQIYEESDINMFWSIGFSAGLQF